MNRSGRIAMVAGEASGDNLGAAMIAGLKRRLPGVETWGVGGPRMIAEGFRSNVDMERLSVNGFVDPIKRLPELFRILFDLRDSLVADPPDAFVGIDYNFFNLLLEGMLHKQGIRTVHYVSPSVWAWRQGRIRKIARSVDLMLTLYPFETEIYRQHDIDVCFVGHPLADEIELRTDTGSARHELGLTGPGPVVAVLPGSRGAEIRYSGEVFLRAAMRVADRYPDADFIIPAANSSRRAQLDEMIATLEPGIRVKVLDGQSRLALAAADVVLVNSGTATLEALLLKKPMVMSYSLGRLTYAIVSRMTRTEFFALPNILAGRALIPELLQDAATPEALASALLAWLDDPEPGWLIEEYDRIHDQLRRNAGDTSAAAVVRLIESGATDPSPGNADV